MKVSNKFNLNPDFNLTLDEWVEKDPKLKEAIEKMQSDMAKALKPLKEMQRKIVKAFAPLKEIG
jgi:hypothetical protein